MLDVWGLRVIIAHKRGGALTKLILFEGGGDVFKNFLQMFQVFTFPLSGVVRSWGGGGRRALCRPPSLLQILLSCPSLSSFPQIESK